MHLKVVQNVKVLKIQLSGIVKDFKIHFLVKKEIWKKLEKMSPLKVYTF